MTSAHQNFISHSRDQAKQLLDIYGELIQLDALWAGATAYNTGITQADIDSVPSFSQSGLTATTLGDAEFALSSIKTTIGNALASLTVLSNLP